MLYQDGNSVNPNVGAVPGATAAAMHVDPEQQQQQQPQLNASTASAASSNAASATRVVAAKLVSALPSSPAALDEPVLVGRVVSAELSHDTSQRRESAGSAERHASVLQANSAAVRASAYSSPFSSDEDGDDEDDDSSYVPDDLDKTELIFDFGRYVGQVDPITGLRDGHGCLHYRSGNVYTGEWRDGAADGFGEKRYKNGDIYRGNWRAGQRSGRGAYLFVQGHFYDGMYVDDAPEGYGIYTTLRGDRYAGRWKAGHKHGKGRETLMNGQVFVGNWRNGKKQGRGKLYLPGAEGYIYGIWNNDKFFRELTEGEMGADGQEDIVDEFGVPRDPSAPPVAPPWTKAAPAGAGVTDRVLMGVTALEDRMESFGKALERVMGGFAAEDTASAPAPPSAAAAAAAAAAGSARGAGRGAAGAGAPTGVLFADRWTGPPADGVVADVVRDALEYEEVEVEEEEEGDAAVAVTLGTEMRRPYSVAPPRATTAAAADTAGASMPSPTAALLSTAGDGALAGSDGEGPSHVQRESPA